MNTYRVTFKVNNEVTCVLENLSADEAYIHAIPGEATSPHEGNRWHVVLKAPALLKMKTYPVGEPIIVAYQTVFNNYQDSEHIYITRTW